METFLVITSFLSIPSFLGKPPTITATLTPVHPSTASVVATTPDKTRSDARYLSHLQILKKISVYANMNTGSETEATFEKGESSIDQLHLDTVESFSSKGNIQHVEDHWLVSTKHDTPCNHRDKSVSNLSCNQITTILSLINH